MNELNCPAPAGATTANAIPYLRGVAQAPIALTKISGSDRFTGDMTGAAGVYQFDFLVDGVFYTSGEIDWDGTNEIRVSSIAAAVRLELSLEMAAIVTMLKTLRNRREVKKVGDVWYLIVYDDDGTTPILSKAQLDKDGNNITDFAAGLLAIEVASTV